jgi:bifunctional non-homologous end joining protein LigD
MRTRGKHQATLFAFDLLYLNGRDLRKLPLLERKARLRKLLPADHPRLCYVDYIEKEGEFMFKHAVSVAWRAWWGRRLSRHT